MGVNGMLDYDMFLEGFIGVSVRPLEYEKGNAPGLTPEQLKPKVCRCGNSDTLMRQPIQYFGNRFVSFRCCQCFRLVFVATGTGQMKWYTVEV